MRDCSRHRSIPGLFLLVCLVGLIGSSCGRALRTDSKSAVTVLVGSDADEYTWATWDYHSQLLVFLPVGDQGETVGSLAESWEHSEDYRTWTVHLRKNVRWHDGTPVTAHDVGSTLDIYARSFLGGDLKGHSFEVLDETSYALTYHRNSRGVPGSPLDGFSKVLPKHLLERLDPGDYSNWDFWTHPVGNGPYRYVRHVPKTMMEFEANPDYYLGKPKIERVVLRFGKTSITPLLSNEVDVIEYANRNELPLITGDPRFVTYHQTGPNRIYVIAWNNRNPLFESATVRRALTMAIDRRELYKLINLPDITPVFDGILTERQLKQGDLLEPVAADFEAAVRLLDKAGWGDHDGDGVLDQNGKRFQFQAVSETLFGMDRAAVFIQSQLSRLGIEMEIVTRDWSGIREPVLKGEFEAAVFSMVPFGGPLSAIHCLHGMGYETEQVFALFEEAEATVNPDRLDYLYREVAVLLQEDLPFTTLYPTVLTTVAHRRVHGLRTPDRASAVAFMWDLWIEDE